eukprot:1139740-Pelagomonas_calceolata.AAC.1
MPILYNLYKNLPLPGMPLKIENTQYNTGALEQRAARSPPNPHEFPSNLLMRLIKCRRTNDGGKLASLTRASDEAERTNEREQFANLTCASDEAGKAYSSKAASMNIDKARLRSAAVVSVTADT